MQIAVISPLPGVFYRQPSPEAPPFVVTGDKVGPDTVIGLIEVMKQFSEIFAETSGTIWGPLGKRKFSYVKRFELNE
ncbi:biotin/lipoyl-containing protein [Klebsiella pneumoniae]